MKLLIDADIVAFRSAAKVENVVDWGDDVWTLTSDLKEARAQFQALLADIIFGAVGATGAVPVLCFSDSMNWRKVENPVYKHNRKGVRKPVAFKPLVEWAMKHMPCVVGSYLEADDVMGIESTLDPDDTIICSIDKDMATIPGLLYNWDKDQMPRRITKEEADHTFYVQCLTGDATDGYPGLSGMGPVGAKKVLAGIDPSDEAALWSAVVAAYEKKGETMEQAVRQARMARICRAGEWDAENLKMVWTPPDVIVRAAAPQTMEEYEALDPKAVVDWLDCPDEVLEEIQLRLNLDNALKAPHDGLVPEGAAEMQVEIAEAVEETTLAEVATPVRDTTYDDLLIRVLCRIPMVGKVRAKKLLFAALPEGTCEVNIAWETLVDIGSDRGAAESVLDRWWLEEGGEA